jgi:hypothetical protein
MTSCSVLKCLRHRVMSIPTEAAHHVIVWHYIRQQPSEPKITLKKYRRLIRRPASVVAFVNGINHSRKLLNGVRLR